MHSTKLVSALAVAGALVAAAPASAATFTVKNDNYAGPQSLAAAITAANNNTGVVDTITFDIDPAAAPHIIQPPSTAYTLPDVTEAVVIDGTTQAGYAGAPIIQIDAVDVEHGLMLASNGSTVRGLALYNAGLTLGAGAPYGNGISIVGNSNTVSGNFLGTNAAGGAFGNNEAGVRIAGYNNEINGNLIADNLHDGVRVAAGTGNVVQSNRIGVAPGAIAMGNLDHGVNVAAGGTRVESNVIVDHGVSGVRIAAGTGSVVRGNKIGTNAAGAPVPNAIGIELGSAAATVEGNVVSNNAAQGIRVSGSQHTLLANEVGTNATGIVVRGHDTTIGAGNVVSGNTNDGIRIELGAERALVEDSTISGNGRDGVALIDAKPATIASNTINDNSRNGVAISNANPGPGPIQLVPNHQIDGNELAGNGASGVRVADSSRNDIENGNTIANNAFDGVTVVSGTANTVLGNTLNGNGGRPIDLDDDGITANDEPQLDADTGANELTNHPSLGPLTAAGMNVTLVAETLRDYRLELYTGTSCANLTPIRTLNVSTNATGQAAGIFAGVVARSTPRYYAVTATEFGTIGALPQPASTSELSGCFVVN
jgi:parallel beta-helix repeat protein